ncbi:MAG TPA: hypothetical protein RMH99_00980 [Sandaracinaceae bacterium LLY-WYZ-13_1]|nr:hypothetical protein [Sandaracinaceae bacterium LLY-WYZ-13_1]
MSDTRSSRGLPGGIALPAVLFALSATTFVVCFTNPELVDLGPHLSPAGLGVLGAAVTFLWLLVAIAKRPPTA